MFRYGAVYTFFLGVLIVGVNFAQNSNAPSADQKRTVRVGIAATTNRSSRHILPTWERDQLVRELQRLGAVRKSLIILEAVSLDAADLEDASPEAAKKKCQYFVLTTVLTPSRGPGISSGPDGTQKAPVLLGNTNPKQNLAIDFANPEIGTSRNVAEGTTTDPVDANIDTKSPEGLMRS